MNTSAVTIVYITWYTYRHDKITFKPSIYKYRPTQKVTKSSSRYSRSFGS